MLNLIEFGVRNSWNGAVQYQVTLITCTDTWIHFCKSGYNLVVPRMSAARLTNAVDPH